MEVVVAGSCLAFLALFCVLGVVFIVASERKRTDLCGKWQRYAARRRLAFREGTSFERPFCIEGARDGVFFQLEAKTDGSGQIVTRLTSSSPLRMPARVVAATGRSRRGDLDGPRAATGDASFDDIFDVRADVPARASSALATSVRVTLQKFPLPMLRPGLRLIIDEEDVVVEWPGDDVNPLQIDCAHAIVAEVQRVATASHPDWN